MPFLKPLSNVSEKEIQGAESGWSEWLAMQDWMLGPRAPVAEGSGGSSRGRGGGGGGKSGQGGRGFKMEED